MSVIQRFLTSPPIADSRCIHENEIERTVFFHRTRQLNCCHDHKTSMYLKVTNPQAGDLWDWRLVDMFPPPFQLQTRTGNIPSGLEVWFIPDSRFSKGRPLWTEFIIELRGRGPTHLLLSVRLFSDTDSSPAERSYQTRKERHASILDWTTGIQNHGATSGSSPLQIPSLTLLRGGLTDTPSEASLLDLVPTEAPTIVLGRRGQGSGHIPDVLSCRATCEIAEKRCALYTYIEIGSPTPQ